MEAMKTMREIAQDLGVSRTTVSLCLSGNATKHKIKSETIKRINAYAEKVGFAPNSMARNLVKRKNNIIGLLMYQGSGIEKSFGALNKAMEILHKTKREFIFQSCLQPELSLAIGNLKGMGARDIIMFGPFSEVRHERKFGDDYRKLIPIMQNINLYITDYRFDYAKPVLQSVYRLGVDKKKFYLNLFDILREHIDGRILCASNCIGSESLEEYHIKNKLAFDRRQHLFMEYNSNDLLYSGKKIAEEVLRLRKKFPVGAVVLHNDDMAISLIDTLQKKGVKVPDDISVIGYNNIYLCPYLKVPLTSVDVPIEKHVKLAMAAILEGRKIPHDIKSEPRVIWRESTPESLLKHNK